MAKTYSVTGMGETLSEEGFSESIREVHAEIDNKIKELAKLCETKEKEYERYNLDHKKELDEYNKRFNAEKDKLIKKNSKILNSKIEAKEQELISSVMPKEYIDKYKIKSIDDMKEMGTDKGRGKKLTPAEREGFKKLSNDLALQSMLYKYEEIHKIVEPNIPQIREAISDKGKRQNLLDAYDTSEQMKNYSRSLNYLASSKKEKHEILSNGVNDLTKLDLTPADLDSTYLKSINFPETMPSLDSKAVKDLKATLETIENLKKQKDLIYEQAIENRRAKTGEKTNTAEKVDATKQVKKVSLSDLTSKSSNKKTTNKQNDLTKFVKSDKSDEKQKKTEIAM